MQGPLDHIRVLDLTIARAGPTAVRLLADWGADVIKVEPAGTSGDYLRDIGPYFIDGDNKNSASSIFFQALNRNKRSITLDILTKEGKIILRN